MKNTTKEMVTKWTIDAAHSEISFKVRHLMISHVKGDFKQFEANICTTGKDFTSAEIDVWIDPSSVNTGDKKRDEHLISPDFFDSEKHKQINFTSNSMTKLDEEGNYELWGELTMKGICKNIKLEVEFGGIVTDPWGKEKAGFSVKGKINRSDWDLTWNTALETGGFMVSDEITISCDIELMNEGIQEKNMVLNES